MSFVTSGFVPFGTIRSSVNLFMTAERNSFRRLCHPKPLKDIWQYDLRNNIDVLNQPGRGHSAQEE